ncbi:hypothetical protein DITRI_Ditri07aG0127400 [Diplodiscus trichospermus]
MYCCVIRNGYKDVQKNEDDFENDLVTSIAEFIQLEAEGCGTVDGSVDVEWPLLGHPKSSAKVLAATYELESPSFSLRRHARFKLQEMKYKDPNVKEELLELASGS